MCVSDWTSYADTASYKPRLNIFARGFRRAYKPRGIYLWGLIQNRKDILKQAIAVLIEKIHLHLLVVFKLWNFILNQFNINQFANQLVHFNTG